MSDLEKMLEDIEANAPEKDSLQEDTAEEALLETEPSIEPVSLEFEPEELKPEMVAKGTSAAEAKATFQKNMAFAVFLILILLIFSEGRFW